jgi:hypothetical protein
VNPEIKNIYENFGSSTCGLRDERGESLAAKPTEYIEWAFRR